MDSQAAVNTGALERFGKEVVAGGLAGALGKSSVAPLERAKILIQTGSSPYARVDHVLRHIYQSEGVTGFFRGNAASIVRIVPYAALHYTTYEHYRAALIAALRRARPGAPADPARPPIWVDLLAGSCSGATAVAVTYPLDLIRTRLAWSIDAGRTRPTSGRPRGHAPARSISRTLQAILQEEGVRGLYRGCTPTLLGILPYAGIKFFTYQSLKRLWADRHGTAPAHPPPTAPRAAPGPHTVPPPPRPPLVLSLAFGGCAGLVAQTLTYPLDIVRRRMQVGNLRAGAEGAHATMAGTARAILQEHGWRGLFRGVSVNYVKVTPATAVGFTAYDQLKMLLGLENHL